MVTSKSYGKSSVFVLACVALATACIASVANAQKAPLPPDGGLWNTLKGFEFEGKPTKVEDARKSVSGIACPIRNGDRVCLFVFDEGVEARFGVLRGKELLPESERIRLLDSGNELDAEGAATDGSYFYVTGSHSNKRKSCAPNEISRHVIRFRVDPQTGRALRDAQGKLSGYQDKVRLWEIMSRHDSLEANVGKCLGTQPPENDPKMKGERGVNIEGLAVKDGKLFFGFRGPAEKGAVPVLSVSADAFFNDGDVNLISLRLAIGQGRGIRDLLAVKDGILVLVGPDDDNRTTQPSYNLLLWDGKGASGTTVQPKLLAQLDLSKVSRRACDNVEIKPEAIALLSESPLEYKVLVLSDGMCDGGALEFTIVR